MPWLLLFALLLPVFVDDSDQRIDNTVTQKRPARRQKVYADLDVAIDAALAQKKPLVCFIGSKPKHEYIGCIVCRIDVTELYQEEAVMVYECFSRKHIRAENGNDDLVTEEQILKAIARVKASIK